jgi:hypothetical protein
MATVIFERGQCISLGSIENEQDLIPREGLVNINPPPKDGRCYCCGRHISELEPFERDNDDFPFGFGGSYLVKTWRPAGPYNAEAAHAVRESERRYSEEGYDRSLEWLIDAYGREKGVQMKYAVEAWETSCADWLGVLFYFGETDVDASPFPPPWAVFLRPDSVKDNQNKNS